MPLGEEICLERGHQTGVPPIRNRYFTAISSASVRTVADRHKQALLTSFPGVPTSLTFNDIELQK